MKGEKRSLRVIDGGAIVPPPASTTREPVMVEGRFDRDLIVAIALAALRAVVVTAQAHREGRLPAALAPPVPRVAKEVMTADEVALFLGVDRKTVYDYAGRGVIPHQRLGKRMLFSRTALVSWLESCSKGSSESSST